MKRLLGWFRDRLIRRRREARLDFEPRTPRVEEVPAVTAPWIPPDPIEGLPVDRSAGVRPLAPVIDKRDQEVEP